MDENLFHHNCNMIRNDVDDHKPIPRTGIKPLIKLNKDLEVVPSPRAVLLRPGRTPHGTSPPVPGRGSRTLGNYGP